MLVVMYAKVVDDKEIGVLMTGIYFGGLAETEAEADEIARKCVLSTQGGTAITRITPLAGNDLKGTVKHVESIFDRMADRMYENEAVITKNDL